MDFSRVLKSSKELGKKYSKVKELNFEDLLAKVPNHGRRCSHSEQLRQSANSEVQPEKWPKLFQLGQMLRDDHVHEKRADSEVLPTLLPVRGAATGGTAAQVPKGDLLEPEKLHQEDVPRMKDSSLFYKSSETGLINDPSESNGLKM